MILIAVIWLTLLGAPGVAQRLPGGSGVGVPKAPTLDQITSYREMNNCSMKPNVEAARLLLAAESLADANRHAARFKWRPCTLRGRSSSFMKVEPNDPKLDELRWMSAEYLLAKDPAAAAALRPGPRQEAYVRPWFAASARDDAIDAMAACVADINPSGIIELNRAPVGSGDERVLLTRLTPDFALCLRTGVTLNGDRKAIRGALIDALYQRLRTGT